MSDVFSLDYINQLSTKTLSESDLKIIDNLLTISRSLLSVQQEDDQQESQKPTEFDIVIERYEKHITLPLQTSMSNEETGDFNTLRKNIALSIFKVDPLEPFTVVNNEYVCEIGISDHMIETTKIYENDGFITVDGTLTNPTELSIGFPMLHHAIKLPNNAVHNSATAKYSNGKLTIRVKIMDETEQ